MRKLNKFVDAISIGDPKEKRKPGNPPFVKSCEGYLIGATYDIGKTKKKNGSSKYALQGKKGDRFDVWGNASINSSLCVDGKIDRELTGKFIRIEYVSMRDGKKGQNAQRVCDVMVDDDDLLTGKKSEKVIDYKLKK